MTNDWRPTASTDALRIRAEVLSRIRTFFAERDILEVETPLLGAAPVTDLHLAALNTRYCGPGHDDGRRLWLQTSPEFAMKRLLAAGSGPIYQLCKAFRDGEAGSRHNPEFTILEWYRPGWDHHRLMDEVEDLLYAVVGGGSGSNLGQEKRSGTETAAATSDSAKQAGSLLHKTRLPTVGQPSRLPSADRGERITYREAFRRLVDVDPHRASAADLAAAAQTLITAAIPDLADDRDGWLDLLMSHVIEPVLGQNGPTFIHDYPASQAALARIRPGDPPVAERFEVWIDGVELANGYHELTDPVEQRQRFEADLEARRERGLPEVPVDERLLAAMDHGLPSCAGVAIGVDRLVMLRAGVDRIEEIIAFPVDRA